jgi:hypothetical protein
MPFTQDDLEKLGYRKQPDGSFARPVATHRAGSPVATRLPDPKPQPLARPALDRARQGQACRPPGVTIRITRRASRLLDADNFAGGCKPIIDQLRYAGLIADDDPETVEIVFRQEKCRPTAAGTLIEIEPKSFD